MELFGIALSIPAAFVASLVYCYLLARIVVRLDFLRRAMWLASVVVLVAFALEVTLLVTLEAVRSPALMGPAFSVAHVAIFFLGMPALANLLVRRQPKGIVRWYWTVPACTVFALVLVLLQYGVSEALYGLTGRRVRLARVTCEPDRVESWLVDPDQPRCGR